ncbi:hypothetical protein Cylst_2405 [Cylindrospermum stagnale PCC 7417]|uniref:Uncharacterized protein n=1 Tax=Cylindrospermum stagnale PCC 7417 TaxID=56107 RepID=K9WXT2_9NOST|nr:hypothetical protein [Cylindrospermum stagnale]AFZ24624.1 hypothetical protein Cylst_2405 [Cylindrospermum stagnale PCC 7417]
MRKILTTCFLTTVSLAFSPLILVSANNVNGNQQELKQTNRRNPNEIPFKVCGESNTWKRPTAAEQRKHLQSLSRYSPAEIEQLGGNYWKFNIFSFINYPGGSGSFDLINRTGLWQLKNPTRPVRCDNYIAELNAKKIAGVWVFSHKIVNIEWVGGRYVMQVKQTKQGAQVIQFPRRETLQTLPLTVVNQNGKKVAVLAD